MASLVAWWWIQPLLIGEPSKLPISISISGPFGSSAAWILPSRGQKLFSCTPSSPLHPELKMSASKDFRGLLLNERSATTTPPPCIGAPATFTSEPSKKFKFDIQAICLFRTLHWPPAYLNHGLVKAAAQLWQGRWRWRFFAAIFRHFPTHHHLLALSSLPFHLALPDLLWTVCIWWNTDPGLIWIIVHLTPPMAPLCQIKMGNGTEKMRKLLGIKSKPENDKDANRNKACCAGRDCIRYDGNYSELRRYQLPSHHPFFSPSDILCKIFKMLNIWSSKSLPSSKRKQTQLYKKEGISC